MTLETICRIRPASQQETLQAQSFSKKKSPSKSPYVNLLTSSGRSTKLIAYNQTPIQTQLIAQYIKTDADLKKYQSTILPNSELFQFDRTFGASTKQLQVYQASWQNKVSELFQGKSQFAIFTGPARSGKRYCLRGLENQERGVLVLATNDILNLMQLRRQQGSNMKVVAQIYSISANQSFDLLVQRGGEDTFTESPIRQLNDITQLYRSAMVNLKYTQKEDSSNIFFSIIIKEQFQSIFKLLPRNDEILARLTFCILPYTSLQFLPPMSDTLLIVQHLQDYIQQAQSTTIMLCVSQVCSTIECIKFLKTLQTIQQRWSNTQKGDEDQQVEKLIQKAFQFQEYVKSFDQAKRHVWISKLTKQCMEMIQALQGKDNSKFKIIKLNEAINYLQNDRNSPANLNHTAKRPFSDSIKKPSQDSSRKPLQENKSVLMSGKKPRDEDQSDMVERLQLKLLKKNEEIAKLKEETIDVRVLWQEDKRLWQNEKNEYERQTDILKEQINDERGNVMKMQVQLEKVSSLLSENSRVKQHLETNKQSFDKVSSQMHQEIGEMQTLIQKLRQDNHALESKLLTKEENISQYQQKIQKLKSKNDQIAQSTIEERMNITQKQNKKTNQIKERVKELENRLVQLNQDAERIKKDNRQLVLENESLNVQMEKQRRMIPTLEDQNKRYNNEINDYEERLEKQNRIINQMSLQIQDFKEKEFVIHEDLNKHIQTVSIIEKQLNDLSHENKQLKKDKELLTEDLTTHKELFDKMERQNQIIAEVQNKDFDVLENKVDKISKEIVKQREENVLYKKKEIALKEELLEYQKNVELLTNALKTQKQKNRVLSKQHEELDKKLRELLIQKNTEINYMRPSPLNTTHSVGNKLKSLENLEQLIRIQKSRIDSEDESSSLSD